MRCLACGKEKDLDKKEVYPYQEEDGICDDPITPLMIAECGHQSYQVVPGWRIAIMCHECWHRMCVATNGIDMWISDACWKKINPITPWDKLPLPVEGEGKWNPKSYAN